MMKNYTTLKEFDLQENGLFIPSGEWSSEDGLTWSCPGEYRCLKDDKENRADEADRFEDNWAIFEERTLVVLLEYRKIPEKIYKASDVPNPNDEAWVEYRIE